jgi:hypothetical protein
MNLHLKNQARHFYLLLVFTSRNEVWVRISEIGKQKSEIGFQKPEIGYSNSEIGNPLLESKYPLPEIRQHESRTGISDNQRNPLHPLQVEMRCVVRNWQFENKYQTFVIRYLNGIFEPMCCR